MPCPPPPCSCPAEIWQEFRNLVFKACMPLLAVVALCYQDEHTNTHGHLPVSHHATHPSRWLQRLSHKGVGADCGGPGFCRAYAIIRWSQHSWGVGDGGAPLCPNWRLLGGNLHLTPCETGISLTLLCKLSFNHCLVAEASKHHSRKYGWKRKQEMTDREWNSKLWNPYS